MEAGLLSRNPVMAKAYHPGASCVGFSLQLTPNHQRIFGATLPNPAEIVEVTLPSQLPQPNDIESSSSQRKAYHPRFQHLRPMERG
jgi:hypothetical protein